MSIAAVIGWITLCGCVGFTIMTILDILLPKWLKDKIKKRIKETFGGSQKDGK